MGKILAVCVSDKKGVPKKNVKKALLEKNHGLVGDAHAGPGARQISLLAQESLNNMRKNGKKIGCGGFGENLTTVGIELTSLVVGTRLAAGDSVLEVTQIGKNCKKPCKIYKTQGACILPSQGIFARVLRGCIVKENDAIAIHSGKKISAGILIISDRGASGEREDVSGQLLIKALKAIDAEALRYKVIPDERGCISSALKDWSAEGALDVIITSGGTGFSPRDITPEATKDVLDKEAPGIAEVMRIESAKHTKKAFLSRGKAGIRGRTLIINFPGSPKAARECFDIIAPLLPHAVEVMNGRVTDCHNKES